MQYINNFLWRQNTTDISKEEYEHIIMRRKIKEYKNNCNVKLSEGRNDVNEMMKCVKNNDLNGVIKIHKRDKITIPIPMLELTISDKYRDEYHYKYKEPFIEACKLGHSDIVKYFYNNNFRVDVIQNLVWYTHDGYRTRRELSENYVYNDVLYIGKNNPELLVFLKRKKEENEIIFMNHFQIDKDKDLY